MNTIDNSKKGIKGEAIIKEKLDELTKEGRIVYLKNYKIPGNNFDIDFIIICDKGVIAVEVKNYTNKLYFSNGDVYIRNQKHPFKYEFKKIDDPRDNLIIYSDELQSYLSSKGLGLINIKKVLVMAQKYSAKIEKGSKNKGIFVACGKDELAQYLRDVYCDIKFTPAVRRKIYNVLK